ncbi:bifunctional serine/threonine-protein kinase/formylglycine-generating enzyme family protein [Xanthomonadaceae bacterium XH05]|nr:bifunctional serine/threonine-protein kinase/formylglycine-generating enzyme family protein [Xanthomonadaceae bacterium XH05]
MDFPGYSVICEIGRGGMATVYRARQVMLDREVALKVLIPALAADPANAQRFLQEARMLASLEHPNVVPVYDVGVTPDGSHYFSMQLLENGDFTARLQRGVSESEVVRVLAAVADALAYAHARGYVHRDVTPANVLFDAEDEPRLTDFGIARAMAATSRITASGLSVGTSHYMSPEQARGAEVDPRSDIYSLGVLCYEALTGKPPFDGEDGFAVAYSHVHEPVPPLPPELARWQPLIDRCLAKMPDGRFQDCGQFIDMLHRIAPAALVTEPQSFSLRRRGTSQPRPMTEISAEHPVAAAAAIPDSGAMGASSHDLVPAPSDIEDDATPASRWFGPLAGLAGLVAVLVVFLWRPWEHAPATPGDAMLPAATGQNPPSLHESDVGTLGTVVALESAAVDASGDEDAWNHTVFDPVSVLLAQADEDIAARRYTTPPGRNALERYRLVQRFEPANVQARVGIERIAATYLRLADEHAGDEDVSLWLGHVQRAGDLARQFNVEAVAAGVIERRDARFAQIMQEADAAVAAWDRERAVLLYERALTLVPDAVSAQDGLTRARRIGRAGFAFHDVIDARNGPEMVIANQLAFSRSPVTVSQFQHYWQSAGALRFGDNLPNCRDRESVFRGSRRRTFLEPGFAQNDPHPVVCITPAMADDYARWLSQRSGKAYRLPLAAELVAVGVGMAQDCGGNVRDTAYRAAYGGREGAACDDGHAATSPVSAFRPARNGLRDTGGNVREWSADCVDSACRERIAVGASWASPVGDGGTRAFPADIGFNTIGFRVVREIQ